MRCFCGLRFGRVFVFFFVTSVLAPVIRISEKGTQDNELDLVCEIPGICDLYSCSFLISKPNYSFFEGETGKQEGFGLVKFITLVGARGI